MKNLTKQQALEKIEELKNYIAEKEKKGYVIRNRYDDSEIFVSKYNNVKEAVLEAIASEANLGEADLRGADLSEADLRGANLSWANLREADLRGANLSEADLREADLRGADLREADLRGADLSEADLRGANLSWADLREAELDSAKFYGKGGTYKLKKDQVEDFLAALGFIVEED